MEDKIKIIEFIMNNDIFVVLLFFVVLLLRNPKELIHSLEAWKTSKTGTLELALKSSHLKGSSRKIIEEKLEQRHFYLSTGLNTEKAVRVKILQVYEHCGGEIGFKHFVRAKDHYRYKKPNLSVDWGIFQIFFLWFYFFTGVLFSCISLIVFFIIITNLLTPTITIQSSLYDILPATLVIVMTTMLSLKSWITLTSVNIVRKAVIAFNEKNIELKTNEDSRPLSNF